MNKTWKSLVALTAGGALAMSGLVGVSSALAIDGEGQAAVSVTDGIPDEATATLTINNVVKGDVFKGYQLLFLDSESKDDNGYKVVYLVNSAYKAAIVAGINNTIPENGTKLDANADDAEIIKWLTDKNNLSGGTLDAEGKVTMADTPNIDTFTAGFMKELLTNVGEDGNLPENMLPAFTATADEGAASVKPNVPVGFYLIEHATAGGSSAPGDGSVANRTTSKYMAMTVSALPNANNTIKLKNGTVTLDKTITNQTAHDANGTAGAASYKVGDVVEY